MPAASAVLAFLLARPAAGARVRFGTPGPQTQAGAVAIADGRASLDYPSWDVATSDLSEAHNPLNFRFMTTDFDYPGHRQDLDNFIKKQIRERAAGSIKDEIVRGHFCAKRGQRAETYYASSLCYWVPELVPTDVPTDVPTSGIAGGVSWQRPGAAAAAEAAQQGLCQGWKGEAGKCLKCSVCHNNARAEGGRVESSSFVEEVPLPPCLKEKDIERQCAETYDASSTPLRLEDIRCRDLLARREDAETAVGDCEQRLQRLTLRLEHELAGELQRAEDGVASSEARVEAERQKERNTAVHMEAECHDYLESSGRVAHIDFIKNAEWLRCPQHQWTACTDGDVACQQRIRVELDLYSKCTRCLAAATLRDEARRQIRVAEDMLHDAATKAEQAQREMRETRSELQQWQEQLPVLQGALRAIEAEWSPQEEACRQAMLKYESGKPEHVRQCAATLYNQSCEKACISQLSAGCGVIEGSTPGDQLGHGGVQVSCSPPQPSWVLAEEPPSQQCDRILASQSPLYSQAVLFAGWLWTKGGGLSRSWEKVYVVLESGDAVRSATLRQYREDPTKSKGVPEQLESAITLWDAMGIAKVKGSHLKRDDESCFLFYHFYRTYKFCAPADEELSGIFSSSAALRDHWVALLKSTFRFKGYVKASPFEGVSRCCCTSSDPLSCEVLSGVELYKSRSPFNNGAVCPADQGYRYYKKRGIKRLPPACLLPKFM